MEVYHGFLRKPFTPVHAFMYERDPTFVRDVTDENDKKVFVFDYEGDEEILAKRNKLRDDIKAHAYVKWRNFSCEYGGKDEDGKLYTSQLQVRRSVAKAGTIAEDARQSSCVSRVAVCRAAQAFEAMVLEDLWQAICFEFPERDSNQSTLARETGFHTQSVASELHVAAARRHVASF